MIDDMDDRQQLADLMNRFLRSVSFEPGGAPRYDELHDLFIPGGILIKAGSDTPEISTVDEFVRPRQASVDAGELTAFDEVELAAIVELFGNVAHRFSTYRKRGTLNGTPIDVLGAIATQFLRTPDGWRITSMAWDDERPGVELPESYRATTPV